VVGVTGWAISWKTHGVHSACVHTGDTDTFKSDHMNQVLAGHMGVVYGEPRFLEGSVMPIVYLTLRKNTKNVWSDMLHVVL
jgi:hypothetical protein